MDDSADETHVEWREWGEDAFEAAGDAGKPVLLALVTEWSEECHNMDRATYAEPRIAANINDGFVPIRVDADRNPHIRERYNMGGFPSTVFCTPEGTILTGATVLGIDGFREILDSVRHTWDQRGEDAGSLPRALQEDPPAGEVTARIEEHMVEQLLATFDDEFGGWGTDVKFPLPRTVEFALVRARDQATRTLDAIQTHLLDTYDGGFYRFSRNRNWGAARCEKLTDENAAVVRALAHGYRYTGEQSYRESAERGVEFLTTTLWTGDAFGASQGGDEEYFRLEPSERADAEAPAVDETVFAGHNGLAIDALLRYHAYTDDETASQYARQARETLTETLVDDGRVQRYADADAPRGLLVDQARTLRGLTTSWSVLGEPGPAVDVAEWTLSHLRDDDGSFRDAPTGGAGLLSEPLYPLDTTVELADSLLDLAGLTGDRRYSEAAHDAVAAFAGAGERMGVEVAHYATVASRLGDLQVIAVGTDAGSDLHRAALRLADHEAVVAPTATGSRTLPENEARLVVDGEKQGTAATPEALEDLLTT
ncbi:hypothetical protein SAMN05216226_11272 [Halovenus aranensis]|uniref:Spermatogenesis-associated protein 20-like TRX domain-containing protein n=1 Tax=Halovenus aranensis TaxID=890420 RepID=A0A1G8XTJ8_9EURY|nr:DUF255 domain-containing protein [Halovenus aranensis]SDJ93848.1 hypothetical protein SAMN05216226_11272 [Halovenus aranensis]